MPAVSRRDVGQALRNVCYCDIAILVKWLSDHMDMFLQQLMQFYLNNVTNLPHLTSHSLCHRVIVSVDNVIVTPLSTMGYTSIASVFQ